MIAFEHPLIWRLNHFIYSLSLQQQAEISARSPSKRHRNTFRHNFKCCIHLSHRNKFEALDPVSHTPALPQPRYSRKRNLLKMMRHAVFRVARATTRHPMPLSVHRALATGIRTGGASAGLARTARKAMQSTVSLAYQMQRTAPSSLRITPLAVTSARWQATTASGDYLQRFGINLTERAREGKLDPVIGRDEEIRRCIQVLSRRTKSNPVLVGSAGVGKTAIAEGLALRIASGDVPESMKNKELYSLDLTMLVAAAQMQGQFEQYLQGVIDDVALGEGRYILFLDELHMLLAANRAGMGAGNIMKPALARGELRLLGATTLDEYRQSIEQDPALSRRFQSVLVEEPTVQDTISILRGLKERYEVHHNVQITDDALVAAATQSHRYIKGLFQLVFKYKSQKKKDNVVVCDEREAPKLSLHSNLDVIDLIPFWFLPMSHLHIHAHTLLIFFLLRYFFKF
eukprot:m.190191 g.190191  ORF g.190191 m.190191 type:complete len:458 (+) comp14809_c0_seq1:170-1543(+)